MSLVNRKTVFRVQQMLSGANINRTTLVRARTVWGETEGRGVESRG